MHFVKYNEFEGIAILRYQVPGRVIGGDRERQDLLFAAVIHTHSGGERID